MEKADKEAKLLEEYLTKPIGLETSNLTLAFIPVSYTHLTLPTKRIV